MATKQKKPGDLRIDSQARFASVLVVRRLIDAGWTNADIAGYWDSIRRRAGEEAEAQAVPDSHYVDAADIADRLCDELLA